MARVTAVLLTDISFWQDYRWSPFPNIIWETSWGVFDPWYAQLATVTAVILPGMDFSRNMLDASCKLWFWILNILGMPLSSIGMLKPVVAVIHCFNLLGFVFVFKLPCDGELNNVWYLNCYFSLSWDESLWMLKVCSFVNSWILFLSAFPTISYAYKFLLKIIKWKCFSLPLKKKIKKWNKIRNYLKERIFANQIKILKIAAINEYWKLEKCK